MNRKNNRRFQKTEQLIQTRVFELLEKSPDSVLTISAICEAVPINRSSFYLHYKDIEGVLDAVMLRLHSELMGTLRNEAVLTAASPLTAAIHCSAVHLNTNRSFYRYYINHAGESLLTGQFAEDYARLFSFFFHTGTTLSELQRSYLSEFIQAGVLAVVTRWLNSDQAGAAEEFEKLFLMAAETSDAERKA
ncbi:MAG: TetR/AcrR family transcriptional regulator [Oscillospiraceae bacterium]|nr:TetR/AcrR family transcriptional regulator [Oscillospiraceae bacterium]